MIITLTLNPSIDYIMQVPEIHMEDTLRSKHAFFQSGGKGINVSRVLTRLNVANSAWGFCGGDTGKWLRSFLDEENVAHAFIETAAPTRINTILTALDTHQQLRVSAPGGAIMNTEEHAFMHQFENLPAGTDWVAMGGSLPPGMTSACMRKLIERAEKQGVPCILDADGEVLKEGIKGKPYLIKPNQFELSRLVETEITSVKEAVAAAKSLIHQDLVQVIVVSMGEKGALLVSHNEAYIGKAPEVPVYSKVGAGDSLVAGLIKGLIEKAPLNEMLRMGIASGTAAVMTPANELCHLHDYRELVKRVDVQPIE